MDSALCWSCGKTYPFGNPTCGDCGAPNAYAVKPRPQTSQDVGKAICAAVGLDPTKVAELTMRLAPGTAAVVNVRFYVNEEDTKRLTKVLRSYTLQEKP